MIEARGDRGYLLAGGYKIAARLGAWTGRPQGEAYVVNAEIKESDEFWLANAALSLGLRVGPSLLVWPHAALFGNTIRATGEPVTKDPSIFEEYSE